MEGTTTTTTCRNFTFRTNIPKEDHETIVKRIEQYIAIHQEKIKYLLIGGIEIAPTTGLRHAHGYVEFNDKRRESSVPNILGLQNGTTWVQAKKKDTNTKELIQHHVKEDTKEDVKKRILIEWPYNNIKTDIGPKYKKQRMLTNDKIEKQRHILDLTTSGDIETIKELYPGDYLRLRTSILAENKKLQVPTEQQEYQHYWIYGKPGTGKNAICKLLFPDAYIVNNNTTFWDGYTNQKQIILHDVDPRTFKHQGHKYFKVLTDGFTADIKHSAQVYIKAQIIITSNYTIKDCIEYSSKYARHSTEQFKDMDTKINDTDYNAMKRKGRYIEISIQKFLFQNNKQLKSERELDELKRNGNGDITKCFKEHGIENQTTDEQIQQENDVYNEKIHQAI